MDRGLFGLYYGVVQKGEDPEKLNRFRVKVHHDGQVTDFAHVLMPMGWYTLPDVGDVVVVAFLGGKLEHPVIVGGVWNDAQKPPEVNEDGKNNFRGYCSRPRDGSRTGHRLIFDDSDKPKIFLADTTNKNLVAVGNFAKAGVGPNTCEVFRPVKKSKGGVAISATDGEGVLEIKCGGALKVTAQNIKMSAEKQLEVVVDGKKEISGQAIKISSSKQINADLKLCFV